MDGAVNGMKLMLPANIILVLAWTLSGICRDLLMSAQYVEGLVTSFGGDVMQLFPFICFAAACVLSFATGASWATFGILVPILVPIAYAVDPSMVFVVLGAVLAGSVFGDHSSPISDTSVLSGNGTCGNAAAVCAAHGLCCRRRLFNGWIDEWKSFAVLGHSGCSVERRTLADLESAQRGCAAHRNC